MSPNENREHRTERDDRSQGTRRDAPGEGGERSGRSAEHGRDISDSRGADRPPVPIPSGRTGQPPNSGRSAQVSSGERDSASRDERGASDRQVVPAGIGPSLFPSDVTRIATWILEAQSRWAALLEENRGLRQQLDAMRAQSESQRQHVSAAQRQFDDARAECESLKLQLAAAQQEAKLAEKVGVFKLFRRMAGPKQDFLLRKLLAYRTYEPEKVPEILAALATYLQDEHKLALEGEKDQEVTLTTENLDNYQVDERIEAFPCQALIIGRGVSFSGEMILRPQLRLIREVVNNDK